MPQPQGKKEEYKDEDTTLDLSPSIQDTPEKLRASYAAHFAALKTTLTPEKYCNFNESWQADLLKQFHQYFDAAFQLYKGDVASVSIKPVHLMEIQPWFESSMIEEEGSYQAPTFFPKPDAPAREQLRALPERLRQFSAATNAIINKEVSMMASPFHFVANMATKKLPEAIATSLPSLRSWLHTFIINFEEIQGLLELTLSKEQPIAVLQAQVQELQEQLSRAQAETAEAIEKVQKLRAWRDEVLPVLTQHQQAINTATIEIKRLSAQTTLPYKPLPPITFRNPPTLMDDDDEIEEAGHSATQTGSTGHSAEKTLTYS